MSVAWASRAERAQRGLRKPEMGLPTDAHAAWFAVSAAMVEVLQQLGWMDDVQRAELQAWRASDIRNARGLMLVDRKAVFRLGRED